MINGDMQIKRLCLFAILSFPPLLGCGLEQATREEQKPSAKVAEVAAVLHLDHAQPKLPTMRLFLADKTVTAELARSVREIATGMMFRESMGENEGMLFVFNAPHQTSFYMKNTLLPLTCAYIGPDGRILELHDMKPLDESSIPAQSANVQFVLEMPQDWFKKQGIQVGTMIVSEKGPLKQVLVGR